MKHALIVSPYFVPCNLAGVHRARIMALGLPRAGWRTTIVAVHPRYYGSSLEPALAELTPPEARMEWVPAWGTPGRRTFGVGDLSLRAFYPMRRRLRALFENDRPDVVFVTVLPGYAGLHGGWAKRTFDIPFVLDYQDPWVSDWGAAQPRFSKAGIADGLARRLEPRFAPYADAITAVSDRTLSGLRARGVLSETTPTLEIPIGANPGDQEVARKSGRSHINKEEGVVDFAFVGTMTDRMLPSLALALRGFQRSAQTQRGCGPALRLHLLGTSGHSESNGPDPARELVAQYGDDGFIQHQPKRISYLDALRTMQLADALLLLGSTDTHYTASKIFPSWLTKRPIVGLAHPQSTVHDIAGALGGIRMIAYDGGPASRAEEEFSNFVNAVIATREDAVPPRKESAFEPYAPEGIGRRYSELFSAITGQHKG
jgi:hypothetical protein